jgi:hypothetical protein
MKKKNVLSILLLIVLIAGCSSGAQFFPADKAQTDGSKITYKQWQNQSEKNKHTYVDEYIRNFDLDIDAGAERIVEALDNIAKDCDDECSKILMIKVISGLSTSSVLISDH